MYVGHGRTQPRAFTADTRGMPGDNPTEFRIPIINDVQRRLWEAEAKRHGLTVEAWLMAAAWSAHRRGTPH